MSDRFNHRIVALPRMILSRCISREIRHSALDDLEEMAESLAREKGPLRAALWYWFMALRSMPRFLIENCMWRTFMFLNYMKLALRNGRRQKLYAGINVAGLGIGMACFLIVMRFVQFERDTDKFHSNRNRIFEVILIGKQTELTERRAAIGAPLAPLMETAFQEIEETVRISQLSDVYVSSEEERFKESRFLYADEGLFRVFSFKLALGDASAALVEPYSVILSRTMKEKYFGSSDPLGKVMTVNAFGNNYDFRVTGVLEDIPQNSTMDFDFVASYSSLKSVVSPYYLERHWDSRTYTYVLLRDEGSLKRVLAGMEDFVKTYVVNQRNYDSMRLELQPLLDNYYHPAGGGALGRTGDRGLTATLSLIAGFVLLIAGINFTNLATARWVTRIQEIGLRKVVGANRGQVVYQFLGESILTSGLALAAALFLVEMFLPVFHRFMGVRIRMEYLNNPVLLAGMAGLAVAVGLLSGLYPALFLSRLEIRQILSRGGISGRSPDLLRKFLVSFQFAVSIFLLIGTFVMVGQLRFLLRKDLGFNLGGILAIPIEDRAVLANYGPLKSRFLQDMSVSHVSASSTVPGLADPNGILMRGAGYEDLEMSILYADPDFIRTLEAPMVTGRDFYPSGGADTDLLLNESALKKFGIGVGQNVDLYFKDRGEIVPVSQSQIVGVVSDFHFRQLTIGIQDVLIKVDPRRYRVLLIRLRDEADPETFSRLRQIWDGYGFSQPFEAFHLDEAIRASYSSIENTAALIRITALLAVCIACLGLLGLSAFTLERRTKEICIRKVHGASTLSIAWMLSFEFVRWSLFANLLAWPLSYYVLTRYLQGYPYCIRLGIHYFVLPAIFVTFLAIVTVLNQSWRAANLNPARGLKYE